MKKLISLFILLPYLVLAASPAFVAGRDYQVISTHHITPPIEQHQVTEFFSYGCPWCYKLEPLMAKLAKSLPDGVHFTRIPVVFEKDWELYAKAYYTADTLGLTQKLSPKLFAAIQDKGESLNSTDAMIAFFVKHGVAEKVARSAFLASPAIDAKLKEGIALMQSYQAFSVPCLVIAGRYKTDLAMVKGDKDKLIEVTQYLVTLANKPT